MASLRDGKLPQTTGSAHLEDSELTTQRPTATCHRHQQEHAAVPVARLSLARDRSQEADRRIGRRETDVASPASSKSRIAESRTLWLVVDLDLCQAHRPDSGRTDPQAPSACSHCDCSRSAEASNSVRGTQQRPIGRSA